jgi:hypothetical protein
VGHDQQQGDTIPNPRKPPEQSAEPADERVLRAKYLDWCSAQVADYFLALTPEEIFEIAERAGREEHDLPVRPLSLSGEGIDLASYRLVVERVTGVLAEQLNLPDFPAWLELYRRDPAAVEERLLGLWEERAE